MATSAGEQAVGRAGRTRVHQGLADPPRVTCKGMEGKCKGQAGLTLDPWVDVRG